MEFARFDLENVLFYCGFTLATDGSLCLSIPGGEVKANRILDIKGELYSFYGTYVTSREMGEIDFTLPAFVDDFDQGLALMSFCLKQAPYKTFPDWLFKGLSMKNALPWARRAAEEAKEDTARRAAWDAAPKAIIDHDFYKLIVNKVKQHIETKKCELSFTFNGAIFQIKTDNWQVGCVAKGVPWDGEIRIKSDALDQWPKRIPKESQVVYLFKGHFHFAKNAIQIPEPSLNADNINQAAPS